MGISKIERNFFEYVSSAMNIDLNEIEIKNDIAFVNILNRIGRIYYDFMGKAFQLKGGELASLGKEALNGVDLSNKELWIEALGKDFDKGLNYCNTQDSMFCNDAWWALKTAEKLVKNQIKCVIS